VGEGEALPEGDESARIEPAASDGPPPEEHALARAGALTGSRLAAHGIKVYGFDATGHRFPGLATVPRWNCPAALIPSSPT